MKKIEQIEKEHLRMDLPAFAPGDTVKVHVKIKEGEKERIQAFQAILIQKHFTSVVRYSKGLDIMAACGQLRQVSGI